VVMETLREVGYDGPLTAEYVPGTLGAAEKAIASLKLIEKM
jgi:sugar phosphate isomerase/epimerase